MAVLKEYLLVISGLFMMPCGINGEIKISIPGSSLSTNGSIYRTWSVDRAVDGRNENPQLCECCTAILRPCSLELNLQQSYLVKRIVLKGRTDGAYLQFKNIKMYTGNDFSQMVEQPFSDVTDTVRSCVLSPPQAMQAIIVIGQREGDYMTICEIEVYRQQDCVNGTYGPECYKTCHCLEGPCDAITGTCGTGCKRGWRGAACNESEIKISIPGSSLSTNGSIYRTWSVDRAVDGRIENPQLCECCTAILRPCSLELNLQQSYLVTRIVLKGRTDGAYLQFENIKMYTGNDFSQMVEQPFSDVTNTVRSCVLSPPQAMQAIIVIGQREGDYMTICEIEVYRQQNCVNGTYGPECYKTCHCLEGPCDAITGTCGTGCKRGWRGAACNETCADGSYGTNCSLTCSAFCRNNRPCHHINGTCIEGCADGYEFSTDKTCNTPCATGLYGHNCSSTCSAFCRSNRSCHNVIGMCLYGCEDGYNFVTDNTCKTTCAAGSYGTNCALTCSEFCRNNRQCHHINGTCVDGCEDGYDFFTDKTCNTPCGHRRYGRDCSSICSEYCHNKQTCHHINGTCPNGCGDGYDFNRDKTCNATCKHRTFGKNCSMDCNCDECHHINGSCAIFKQQCDTGFKMDKDICQPCERRRFGPNCANDCHCEQCHNVNGSCALYTNYCDGGYRLENGLCKPCGQRRYGQNCSTECHCERCHNVNGSCALYSSYCDMGYRMENDLCIENSEASSKLSSFSTGAIGGGVAAAVTVTIVIIVAVVCYKRRRLNK
ncbi:hypothetical protein DPMN_191925 [Dreissena polymorpha]|uniref:EGF-like domain-containing protein n=1 Tax=Dreissena polymorpha TaxID=45954 RepID=A0A9D4BCY8_DREPO|nr:hypothetical protein DPMN_191925 [Dreissena polymorpha]